MYKGVSRITELLNFKFMAFLYFFYYCYLEKKYLFKLIIKLLKFKNIKNYGSIFYVEQL